MEKLLSAREIALKALYKIEKEHGYSNIVLDDIMENIEIKPIDRPLVTELVYGVISRMKTLDFVIQKYSNIKLSKISIWIMNILRLGLYQILFLTRIPVSAACSESVNLAKRYGHKGSTGFVNAILRKAGSDKDVLKVPENIDFAERISILESYPRWLVEMWIEQFGTTFTEKLCIAGNEKAENAIRINTLKTNRQEVKRLLDEKGIESAESELVEEALIFKKGNPVNELFSQGLYTVQDEAAMIVSKVLNPSPGDLVADVCSAPGGKTTHIAQLMQNKGKIIAFDIHKHRLELIEKTAKRLGAEIIETLQHDSSQINESLIGKCDKVLADVPCSGLGVIRRKPEIKWSRSYEDIANLSHLQKKILNASAVYVKCGGRLVYSTCTIGKHENEDIIEEFLKENKNFAIDSEAMAKYRHEQEEKSDFISFYPHTHKTDGFFIAALKRIKD